MVHVHRCLAYAGEFDHLFVYPVTHDRGPGSVSF